MSGRLCKKVARTPGVGKAFLLTKPRLAVMIIEGSRRDGARFAMAEFQAKEWC